VTATRRVLTRASASTRDLTMGHYLASVEVKDDGIARARVYVARETRRGGAELVMMIACLPTPAGFRALDLLLERFAEGRLDGATAARRRELDGRRHLSLAVEEPTHRALEPNGE
jgi:hypothetical protein